jgi:sensor histidine kinase YesM
MIDRDKISKDIEFLKNKHGSFRAAAKATEINKASLENYFDKTTEPREKNIIKLAVAMHKDPAYYYSTGQGEQEAAVQQNSSVIKLQAELIQSMKEINLLQERIRQLEEERKWTGKERRGTG